MNSQDTNSGGDRVLIWSNEHRAWWRDNSQGYAINLAAAGLYPRAEAERIVAGASKGDEQIVELDFAFISLQGQAYKADMALGSILQMAQRTKVLERT